MTDATNDEARVVEIRADLPEVIDTWGLRDEVLIGEQAEIASLVGHVKFLLDQRDRYKAAVDAVLDEADALDEIASEFSLTEAEAAGLRMAARGIRNVVTEALG